jgi:hypothetical protein
VQVYFLFLTRRFAFLVSLRCAFADFFIAFRCFLLALFNIFCWFLAALRDWGELSWVVMRFAFAGIDPAKLKATSSMKIAIRFITSPNGRFFKRSYTEAAVALYTKVLLL